MRVYVASPLGFTEPTRHWYAQVLLPRLAEVEVLDPWAANAHLFDGATDLATANREAGATNERLIRSADAVLAVLDGVDVDSGTAAEIGFAAALGIPVVGWRSDVRQVGDNSAGTVNLQVEHWLSGPVRTGLDEAVQALMQLGAPSR